MEHIIVLTEEQEIGIAEEASHNNKTVEEYLQWRIDQYAELGNKRLVRTNTEAIVDKLYAEPTIVDEVKIVVDEKVAVLEVAREAEKVALEEAAKLEEPIIETPIEEPIIKGVVR